MQDIKVSVLTTTYNHETYVEDTLKGILSQKTDFEFELIIHDDCSSDRTQEIIKKYKALYSDRITAILQKENQYSKGIDVYDFIYPAARGEYFAFCEGDDYWTNPNKLQCQINFLETHPEYCACVHNTISKNMVNGRKKQINSSKEPYDIPLEELLLKGSSAYHTSSLVVRRDRFMQALESDLMKAYSLDYSLAISLRLLGNIHYIPDVMSVYRQMSGDSSWSYQMYKNRKKEEYGFIKHLEVARLTDFATHGEYSEQIDPVIVNYCQRILHDYPLKLRWKVYKQRLPFLMRTFAGRIKRKLLKRK